jgi:uncharacterized RDD family membrane protein YckC
MTKKLTFTFYDGKKLREKIESTVHNTKIIIERKNMDQQIFNKPPTIPMTPDPISPPVPVIYAGFLRRFFAMLIDTFFTGILSGMLSYMVGRDRDIVINLSTSALVGIIYTAIFDSSELMGTPGKAMLGIAVTTEKDQNRINFQTGLLRFLCKYLSSVVFLIGFLIQPFTEKRQTFHDIVTNTVVIKKDPGQLSYWKAFKDNFNKIINN